MPTVLAAVVMNDVGPVVETEGLDFIIDYIKEDRPHDDWDACVVTIKKMLPNLTFQDEGIWLKMAEKHVPQSATTASCASTGTSTSPSPCSRPTTKSPICGRFSGRSPTFRLSSFGGAESDILSPQCFADMQKAKP